MLFCIDFSYYLSLKDPSCLIFYVKNLLSCCKKMPFNILPFHHNVCYSSWAFFSLLVCCLPYLIIFVTFHSPTMVITFLIGFVSLSFYTKEIYFIPISDDGLHYPNLTLSIPTLKLVRTHNF